MVPGMATGQKNSRRTIQCAGKREKPGESQAITPYFFQQRMDFHWIWGLYSAWTYTPYLK